MKTTIDTPRIKRIIMDQLMDDVDQSNDGRVIGARRTIPMSDLRHLKEHDVKITKLPNESKDVIMIDGKPVWNVVRRYASRKVNGSYKQLKPSIVAYVVDPRKDEWARINAALASVEVEKAKATAYRWTDDEVLT